MHLLSTLTPPPPGFVFEQPTKRLLLGRPLGVFTDHPDTLAAAVPDYRRRMQGVIATLGPLYQHQRLSSLLWHLQIPEHNLSDLQYMVHTMLDMVANTIAGHDNIIELTRLTERAQYDLEMMRGDYQRVTTRLQQQVATLKSAQTALQASELRLKQIINMLPQWVYATAPGGLIMLVNSAFADALMRHEDQIIGQTEADLGLPADWLAASHAGDEQVMVSGETLLLPELPMADGPTQVRWYQVTKLPLHLAGHPYAVLTVATDITARKTYEHHILRMNEELEQRVSQRTEELEVVNRELESFAYSVSHDLRSPLRAIIGFSQVLVDEAADRLNDDERQLLKRLQVNGFRMNQLIDDLLALARATQMPLHRQTVDVTTLAREVTHTLLADHPHLATATVDISEDMTAPADARMLQVVLENLVSNALKFTRQCLHPHLTIGTQVIDDEPVFFVADNGAGFDMQWAQRLFTPFQRLHADNEFEGTGIGLATVKRVITRHGGRIWADAAVGKGATFYFTLPAAENGNV
ncbi:ATP-binding protein [Chitinivorax sp. B]|uniref:sensor histidine kinase n=1 Tax=Chitinivorax sp. B TaxID=2502235 RepID=UPI0010F864D0|nr:ATP-binding protein [Chitinivorax sp. B]